MLCEKVPIAQKNVKVIGTWWEIIFHCGKSFSTVGFPACLASRHPSIGISTKEGRPPAAPPLWRRPEAASPMDGCLEARQAGNPTVENDFPPWEMVSHRVKWFPTVGNYFPPWDIISYCFSLFFRPYILDPINVFPIGVTKCCK